MNLNKKSIGIIILLIAVIGGGFWYFSKEQRTASKEQAGIVKQQEVVKQDKEGLNNQTEDKTEELKIEDIDTSNWKTYRNEEFEFEVKYPEGWEVNVYQKNKKILGRVTFGFSNCKDAFGGKIMPKECIWYGIDVYDRKHKNIVEYESILKEFKYLSLTQYQKEIRKQKKRVLNVYGIYKKNNQVDNTWDLTKPQIKGFFSSELFAYKFGHATEIDTQEKGMNILMATIHTFELLK